MDLFLSKKILSRTNSGDGFKLFLQTHVMKQVVANKLVKRSLYGGIISSQKLKKRNF
jgi:hypothetical protein